MRARLGAHRHTGHAGQRLQPFAQFVNDGQCALDGSLRRQRVNIGKAGHPRHFFIQARIMLHGAGAKREQPQIDGVILTAEASVMAHRLRFRKTRQACWRSAFQPAQPRRRRVRIRRRQVNAATLAGANLEDQPLFQHQCAIAGGGLRALPPVSARRRFRPPSALVQAHASALSSAVASRSTSSG